MSFVEVSIVHVGVTLHETVARVHDTHNISKIDLSNMLVLWKKPQAMKNLRVLTINGRVRKTLKKNEKGT